MSGEREDSNQYLQAIGVVLSFLPALTEAKALLEGGMAVLGAESGIISGEVRSIGRATYGRAESRGLGALKAQKNSYDLWENPFGRGQLGPARAKEIAESLPKRTEELNPMENDRGFRNICETEEKYDPKVKYGTLKSLGWAGEEEYSDLVKNFYSRPNHAGGQVYLSTYKIGLGQYQNLVHASQIHREPVVILTGAHGNPVNNGLLADHELFLKEKLYWKEYYPEYRVRIEDIYQIRVDYPRIHYMVNTKATIICAWCWSENSWIVTHALKHSFSKGIPW